MRLDLLKRLRSINGSITAPGSNPSATFIGVGGFGEPLGEGVLQQDAVGVDEVSQALRC